MPAHNFIDLTGQTFGNLYVIKRIENTIADKAQWKCQCSCGNITITTTSHLLCGHTKSCGCLRAKVLNKNREIHKMVNSPEHNSWRAMKERCYDPSSINFNNYGGRGIKVCDKWKNSFLAFYKDMGPRPKLLSLDRIDNNGNYDPNNTRWATRLQQANNGRHNHKLTLHHWTLTIAQWTRFVGCHISTIHNRIRLGWPTAKAIFQPVKHRRR